MVGFDSETDKQSILSAAPRLRSSNEFKQVYIVTDMTKLERERHKKVVTELKRRRSSGETDLIIHNGNIVFRLPRTEPMQHNSAVHTSAQTPKAPTGGSSQSS